MRSRPYDRTPASEVRQLIYRGPVPMVLRGPGSTSLYRLTVPDQAVEVDPLDVDALLRTGWFGVA